MRRRQQPHDGPVEFTIDGIDGIDGVDGVDGINGGDEQPGGQQPATGAGVPLRWCIAAVALAAVCSAGAGAVYHHRSQPVITTKVLEPNPGKATEDLTGCPLNITCGFGFISAPQPDEIANAFPNAKVAATVYAYGTGDGANFRTTTLISDPSGVTVTIVAQYQPSGPRPTASTSAMPTTGPADVSLITLSERPGVSASVSAHIPAGVPVPVAALKALAADSAIQLY